MWDEAELKNVRDCINSELPNSRYIELLTRSDSNYLCVLDICQDLDDNCVDDVLIVYDRVNMKVKVFYSGIDTILAFSCLCNLLNNLDKNLNSISVLTNVNDVIFKTSINYSGLQVVEVVVNEVESTTTFNRDFGLDNETLYTVFKCMLGGGVVELNFYGILNTPLLFLIKENNHDSYYLGLELDRLDQNTAKLK